MTEAEKTIVRGETMSSRRRNLASSGPEEDNAGKKKRVKQKWRAEFSAAVREPGLKKRVASAWARKEALDHGRSGGRKEGRAPVTEGGERPYGAGVGWSDGRRTTELEASHKRRRRAAQ